MLQIPEKHIKSATVMTAMVIGICFIARQSSFCRSPKTSLHNIAICFWKTCSSEILLTRLAIRAWPTCFGYYFCIERVHPLKFCDSLLYDRMFSFAARNASADIKI